MIEYFEEDGHMDYLFKSVHKIDYDDESFVEVEMQPNFDNFAYTTISSTKASTISLLSPVSW